MSVAVHVKWLVALLNVTTAQYACTACSLVYTSVADTTWSEQIVAHREVEKSSSQVLLLLVVRYLQHQECDFEHTNMQPLGFF